jgi:lipoprotein signal peptidase
MTHPPNARSATQSAATIAAFVVVLDESSKAGAVFMASRNFDHGVINVVQNPDFSLSVATAAFPIMLVLSSLGILVFGAYTTWAATRGVVPAWVPGLLIGGALGNLADRLVFGAVHDWLDLGKVVVNLADLAVLIGLVGYSVALASTRRQL